MNKILNDILINGRNSVYMEMIKLYVGIHLFQYIKHVNDSNFRERMERGKSR
jgi:hypothetical protein